MFGIVRVGVGIDERSRLSLTASDRATRTILERRIPRKELLPILGSISILILIPIPGSPE